MGLLKPIFSNSGLSLTKVKGIFLFKILQNLLLVLLEVTNSIWSI